MSLWTALCDDRIKAAEVICYSDRWAAFGMRDLNYCGMQVVPAWGRSCSMFRCWMLMGALGCCWMLLDAGCPRGEQRHERTLPTCLSMFNFHVNVGQDEVQHPVPSFLFCPHATTCGLGQVLPYTEWRPGSPSLASLCSLPCPPFTLITLRHLFASHWNMLHTPCTPWKMGRCSILGAGVGLEGEELKLLGPLLMTWRRPEEEEDVTATGGALSGTPPRCTRPGKRTGSGSHRSTLRSPLHHPPVSSALALATGC